MKNNLELKRTVLRSNLPNLVNNINKTFYAHSILHSYGEIIKAPMQYERAVTLWNELSTSSPEEYAEANKILNARYERIRRSNQRINFILENCETVTFTTFRFSSTLLETNTVEQLRKKLQTFLTESGFNFVGGIHFGKKNHVLHFHVVVGGRIKNVAWRKYGRTYTKYVKGGNKTFPKEYENSTLKEKLEYLQKNESKRLSKYLVKLSEEVFLNQNQKQVMLYSRKVHKEMLTETKTSHN